MPETSREDGWSAAWGVVALILASAAVASWMGAMPPGPGFPRWPAWMLSALTAVAIYICFACLSGGWRARRRDIWVTVDPIPEQVGDVLRLGLLNGGHAAEFSAQVIRLLDPFGNPAGPQHWPIPWFEDHSAEPKRILAGQTRMLDFARYDRAAVDAELRTGCDIDGHWQFSSVPDPVSVSYYHLRSSRDLRRQRFIVTVRIMNATSGGYRDHRLTIMIQDNEPICKVALEDPYDQSRQRRRSLIGRYRSS